MRIRGAEYAVVDAAKVRVTVRDSVSSSETMTARFHELDAVVLLSDVPHAGLRSGDRGALVLVYGDDALGVEFVTASGRTQALLTLPVNDVRPSARR